MIIYTNARIQKIRLLVRNEKDQKFTFVHGSQNIHVHIHIENKSTKSA